ncbi:MAG: hypothetical protein K2J20_03640 [Bacilli bacterium]|nr:hypothetical protein [Bacilli bacterium]
MKKYYQTLTKEKKQEIKTIYKKEYAHSDLKARLQRLVVYAIASYIFAAVLLVYNFISQENDITNIICAISLIVLGTVYLIGRYIAKLNILNKVALKNK